jgi:hypothetical protein
VEGSCEHGDETSGSLKLLGVSWVAARLAASQEGLSLTAAKFKPLVFHCSELTLSLSYNTS